MNTANSHNLKNNDLNLSILNQSNHNNTIGNLSGQIEKNEYITQAMEPVQSNNKLVDLLKRIDERKARIYHNNSGSKIETITIIS